MNRRRLLRSILIGVPAAGIVGAGAGGWMWASADISTVGKVSFTNRLAIPALAPSRRDSAGRRVFDLRARTGQSNMRPGQATATWGFEGDYLGPTLRATPGETVLINVRNDLPEATSVHWHGMHLPPAMDGGPHQPILPGASWSPTWTVKQPPATLWYHPHPHGSTARHVYRGLAGLFLIDDPAAPALPRRYGVDDIPVIVQDRRFDDENQFVDSLAPLNDSGILGDTILVNGTVGPYAEVTTTMVRLRLVNASNARTYNFGFADDRRFALIATDGGFLAMPHATQRIQLSPGERAEIVVSVRADESIILRAYPPRLGTNFWLARFNGGDDSFDILELRAAGRLDPSPELPAVLAEAPSVAAISRTRTFEIVSFAINGQPMDMGRLDTVVTVNTTEAWEVTNIDDVPHNFHVHDVQFVVLSIDGAPAPPELRGWKDTVYIPPHATVRIGLRFADYTDPNVPYMYHCHLLWHEDSAMMGQFVVVEPGQQAGSPHAGH